MRYLAAEEILSIHLEVIREFGGTFGLLDNDSLTEPAEREYKTMQSTSGAASKGACAIHLN